jgi:hypothetical protein
VQADCIRESHIVVQLELLGNVKQEELDMLTDQVHSTLDSVETAVIVVVDIGVDTVVAPADG